MDPPALVPAVQRALHECTPRDAVAANSTRWLSSATAAYPLESDDCRTEP